jgi:zinc protease
MTDPLYFPLYVANHAFGGGSFSSRLMVEIRVKRGWSYGAGSNFRYGTQPRSWGLSLFPASLYTHLALGHTLKMVEELKDRGITQEEFDFAKQSLINNAGFSYNTPGKRVENILLERTLNLPDGFIKNSENEIRRVSLDQVNASLKKFLKPEDLQIVVLCTAKDLKDKLAAAAGVRSDKVQIVDYRK